MAAPKGRPKPKNSGRKKGVTNQATKDIKEAYRMLIEKNLDNLTKWLEKIAETDPYRAILIISDLSEYVIPKLARTDLVTDGEKLNQHSVIVKYEE
jgi:hypothetical protein